MSEDPVQEFEVRREPNPLMPLIERLYPICRSITGDGVRQTLSIVSEWIPLKITEVPSGTAAFDWTVPDEWNIRDAWIANTRGRRIVDFRESNLHVLNYSEPVDLEISREELEKHLYSLPDQPDRIPYRTSYYSRRWGFCLKDRVRRSLNDERYRVKIDAELAPGSLTYGECLVPGVTEREVLIYTHICHPSLCNDNLTGIAVAAALARRLRSISRLRYSYRFIFAPGTIGSIVWLSRNQDRLDRVAHGLVIGLLGDNSAHTYKASRDGRHEIDEVARYVVGLRDPDARFLNFSPYGYDERQFGSPGINLPVGRLTRSENGGYSEYHTSADDLSIVEEQRLQASLGLVMEVLNTVEKNRYFVNLKPYCEPQLGKRGLYRDTGGIKIAEKESAMLWLLNQSDGTRSLLEIAKRSGIAFSLLVDVAGELVAARLLEEAAAPAQAIP